MARKPLAGGSRPAKEITAYVTIRRLPPVQVFRLVIDIESVMWLYFPVLRQVRRCGTRPGPAAQRHETRDSGRSNAIDAGFHGVPATARSSGQEPGPEPGLGDVAGDQVADQVGHAGRQERRG